MADSETAFVSEANDSDADNPKVETKRLSHAFSIEKLLSMTSETTSEMCLRTTSEESLEPTGVGRAGNKQQIATDMAHLGLTGEDHGTPQYRRCSYGRTSAITSIASADSSSVGLRPECCSDCGYDQEREDTDGVSTTLTDGESSEQGPQSGEFRALMFGHLATSVPTS
jgi:hypothetical protein